MMKLFSILFLLLNSNCSGFIPLHSKQSIHTITTSTSTSSFLTLSAKKGGKGFAKNPEPTKSKPQPSSSSPDTSSNTNSDSFQLQSIDSQSQTDSPALNSKLNKPVNIDPNASPEERSEQILRQRFGMRTYEEEQGDIVAMEKRAAAKERADRLKKLAAIDDGSFDIFAVLPTGLVKFIDLFLKTGLAVSTLAFVAAGVGICFEAYATSSGNPLPEDMDQFIVNVIEPNFTPGLLVLLGFSISLGLFASAQLGSASSQYQEKP